jgi:hypothetical protein
MITCVYAIQKNETHIDEWIKYHLNLGFDYIILGDNNDIGNELNISDYNGKVIVVPLNGIDMRQCNGYHNVLLSCPDMINNLKYYNIDYCCNIDLDEFVELKQHSNIKDFIKKHMIDDRQLDIISIRWETYDDNNIIYKSEESDSVLNDYKHNLIPSNKSNWCVCGDELSWTKIIFKTSYLFDNNLYISSHCLYKNKLFYGVLIDDNIISINHFRTKCLERYLINKCILNKSNREPLTLNGEYIIGRFFEFNKLTKEKLIAAKEICNKYNIELSEYDKKLLEQDI